MPRFYFHLFNDLTTMDEEGAELRDDASAMIQAATYARDMAAESVRDGHLTLSHRIDVEHKGGRRIRSVYFRDVIQIAE